MRNIAIGNRVYDDTTYRVGKVVEYNDNIVKLTDEDYNTWLVNEENAYLVNEELSEQYGILICDEHNKDIDYPYYIPIADKNAYSIELEHFADMYS